MLVVNMIFTSGGPQLGVVRAGIMAAALGAPLAIISGGIMAALVALFFAWGDPMLRQYTSDKGYDALRADANAGASAD
jgi:hypothetical protein